MKSDYFQNIKITHLDFADPPKFQDLKVIGLEEDGTILVDGQFDYSGLQMSLEVSVNLKVPGFNFFNSTTAKEATDAAHSSGFLLNVSFNFVLKQLKGKILLKIPSLPVNQLFYGFYNDPIFEVSVEPKVSNRQLKIGVLGSLLEKRILEIFKESLVLPRTESRTLFPLHFVHDAPAPADILERLTPTIPLVASPTKETVTMHRQLSERRKKSMDAKSTLEIAKSEELPAVKGHSQNTSIDQKSDMDQPQDIPRSAEVNDIITKMFGSELSTETLHIQQPQIPHEETPVVHEEAHKQLPQEPVQPQPSRFAKLATGTSFVARKVQKIAKDSFTATTATTTTQPPPIPTRPALSLPVTQVASTEDLSSSNKLKKMEDNIGKYLDSYKQQHLQAKTEIADDQEDLNTVVESHVEHKEIAQLQVGQSHELLHKLESHEQLHTISQSE